MSYIPKKRCKLFPYEDPVNLNELKISVIIQKHRECVPCVLAMLVNANYCKNTFQPSDFFTVDNTNPINWSSHIKKFGIKLVFCVTSINYLDVYIPELKKGTFIACVYTCLESELFTENVTSHAFIIAEGKVYDSNDSEHIGIPIDDSLHKYSIVKNIFRVVESDYKHEL